MRLAAAALMAMVVACGGGENKVEGPSDDGTETAEEDDRTEMDEMVSQEVLDGIKRVFERKVTIVGRCFVEAMDAGELTKRDKVIVTVSTTIRPDGSASGTEITKASTGSETMKSCVIRMVSGWQFPAPPNPLPFSHVYRFEEF